MDIVKPPAEGQDSLPVWVYAAVGGGVILAGTTATVVGNFLWRRRKVAKTAERKEVLKQDYIEAHTPRENPLKEPPAESNGLLQEQTGETG